MNLTKTIEKKGIDKIVSGTAKLIIQSSKLAGKVEKNIIDASIMGIFSQIKKLGDKIRKWGNGNIQDYMVGFLIAFIVIVFVIILIA